MTSIDWAAQLGRRVPGSRAAPLREVGHTAGWIDQRSIYAYAKPGASARGSCGWWTFLKLASGRLVVYSINGDD